MRAEAEREFVRTRLAQLPIDFACQGQTADTVYWCHNQTTITQKSPQQFVELNDDGQRARLKLDLSNSVTDLNSFDSSEGTQDQKQFERDASAAVSQVLQDVDINFGINYFNRDPTTDVQVTSRAFLGGYVNNNPFMDLNINISEEECTIDWKRFLDVFYGDYAYAGRVLQRQTPYQAVLDIVETAKLAQINSVASEPKSSKFAAEESRTLLAQAKHDRLFEQAYIARVQRAFAERGLTLSLNTSRLEDLKKKADGLRTCKEVCICPLLLMEVRSPNRQATRLELSIRWKYRAFQMKSRKTLNHDIYKPILEKTHIASRCGQVL